MKRCFLILSILTFFAELLFAGADFDFAGKGKLWRVLGGGKIVRTEGGAKFEGAKNSVMFEKIVIDPDREYEISAEGSGACSLYFLQDKSVNGASNFSQKYVDIFKDGGSFKTSLKFPRDCAEKIKINLRTAPKKGNSFTISRLKITEKPDGRVWLDRKKLRAQRPSPDIVRGVAVAEFSESAAAESAKRCSGVVEIFFRSANDVDDLKAKAALAAKNGISTIISLSPKSPDPDAALRAAYKALAPFSKNVWAWSLADASVSRAEFARRLGEFRKYAPDSWVVFKTGAKALETLQPFADYRVVYSCRIYGVKTFKMAREFANVVPAPFLAFGKSSMIPDFERHNMSWIIDTYSPEAARPLCKGAPKEAQFENLLAAYRANDNSKSLNFAFATDTHYSSNKKNPSARGATAVEHMRDMARAAKILKLDFVCNGGDMVNGAKFKKESMADMREIVAAMSGSGLPAIITIGNHDDGVFYCLKTSRPDDSEIVTGAEWHDICVAPALAKGGVGDANFAKSNYFYMDFPQTKIRFINIAVSENPMEVVDGRVKIDSCGLYAVSGRQLKWLAEQALDFSSKPDASEWAVVLLSHSGIGKSMGNGSLVMGILDAFQKAKSFSGATVAGHFPTKISCDFSGRPKMKVLAAFEGHVHYDKVSRSPLGWVRIQALNDCNKPEWAESPPRHYGAADDASWSVVSVDRRAREIRVLRFGAGNDFTVKF